MLGADGELQGYNLFAYCGNNPVNRIDENGHFKPFGEKAALDFVMAHVITDVNVGSATTIISEACQSMVSERVASAVFNHAKMMGKTLYKLEAIA